MDNPDTEKEGPKQKRFILLSKTAIYTVGVLTMIAPLLMGGFRDLKGDLLGTICLPMSIGIACIVIGLTYGGKWKKTGFLFALGLIGQAAALQLINAGPDLRYQHYKPIGQIFSYENAREVILILLQACLVLISLFSYRTRIREWAKKELKLSYLLVLLVLFLVPTTTLSEDVYFYLKEWVFAAAIVAINLVNVVVIGLSIPAGEIPKLRELTLLLFPLNEKGNELSPGRPDRFVIILAVSVFAVTGFLTFWSYERHPHVPDEVAYLIHARIFASGALTVNAPPVPEAFEAYLLEVDGDRMFPVPPPGWPLVLALGVLLGIPWLVNPLLAGLNIVLAYHLLRELYSLRESRLILLLLAFSPWYIFLGMSLMTHMSAMTCALLATLGVAWSRRSGKVIWALLGGFALGFVALNRPLEAVAMAGLLGLWSIGLGGKRLKLLATASLVFGSMLIGGGQLLYNKALSGNATVFPIMAYADKKYGPHVNDYGFGPDRGFGWALDPNPGHGPVDALINSNLNGSAINTELFGWSIGAFLFIGLFLCFSRYRQSDYLMFAVIFVVYVLHFFYYFSGGPDFAARYWFLMILPLIALSARGILSFADRFKDGGEAKILMVIACLLVMNVINFIPWRAVDKYRNFRGMRPDVRFLAEKHNFGKSLVLVEGNLHPDYDSAMIYNPLDLFAEAPIFALDRDPETRLKLLQVYRDRPVWIIKSPSLTGRGFELSSGPHKAEDLLEKN